MLSQNQATNVTNIIVLLTATSMITAVSEQLVQPGLLEAVQETLAGFGQENEEFSSPIYHLFSFNFLFSFLSFLCVGSLTSQQGDFALLSCKGPIIGSWNS